MEEQTEIKTILFIKPRQVFAVEAGLFCLTLILGIAGGFRINEFLKIHQIPLKPISFWNFIFSFLLASLFILFILYFLKFKPGKRIIFKGLFILATFFSGFLFLNLWVEPLLTLILMAGLTILWLRVPTVLVHDSLMILAMAGIGSILGLRLTPEVVIALFVVLSIYDFIAVYKTKHMLKMAKEMLEANSILALTIPSDIPDFKKHLGEAKPGGNFLFLGGGDVILPLLLSVSLIPQGLFNVFIAALFSLFGLFVSFLIFTRQKVRQPIPALPPIALFSILGFLITLII